MLVKEFQAIMVEHHVCVSLSVPLSQKGLEASALWKMRKFTRGRSARLLANQLIIPKQ